MILNRITPALLLLPLLLAAGPANAGSTIEEKGALVCVVDKWDETEPEKGHKLVDFVGRCVDVPDEDGWPIASSDCTGKYEYMPDGSWKGTGGCTLTYKGGDTRTDTWEEGSHLKLNTYKITGGTGKYKGATGSGTYSQESLTDTLGGGRYKGTVELP